MGRFPSSGAIALVATVGVTGPATTAHWRSTSCTNCRHPCRRVCRLPHERGCPGIANPTTTRTGTFIVPSDFASIRAFTFDSRGQILVSGDTSSNKEMLTDIGGYRALGS